MKYEIMHCAEADADYVDGKIVEYNLSQMPAECEENRVVRWFGKKMTDGCGRIIAGCVGVRTVWGTAELSVLWVDEAYRNQGLGSLLLREAECEVRNHGCSIIQLDTFDWQAKGFYEKNGYSLFGTLKDCPKGHCRYYMSKSL